MTKTVCISFVATELSLTTTQNMDSLTLGVEDLTFMMCREMDKINCRSGFFSVVLIPVVLIVFTNT